MNKEQKHKIVEKTISFYEKTFSNVQDGKDYLSKKGITDTRLFEKYRIGYSNGSLLQALPSSGEIIEDLKTAGIIVNGKEYFQDCITIPIVDENQLVIDIAGFNVLNDESATLLCTAHYTLESLLGIMPMASKGFPASAGNLCAIGTICKIGNRKYELIDVEKEKNRLKATIRFSKGDKFHVDTLNFYSSKETRQLQQDICLRFDEIPETIQDDINQLIKQAEDYIASGKNDLAMPMESSVSMVNQDKAIEYGKSPDIIKNILQDFESCGLVGEENNKLLCYLAMTSRKMSNPLNVMLLSSSGAGKSKLQDTTLKFCPIDELVKLTSLSGKALFYKESTSLKHKVLALEEDKGANEASYAIRNIISSDMLVTESTIRDSVTGKITTMSNTVQGPVAVFITSTNPDTDAETKSRFFVIGIDESLEQTRRIIEHQKKQRSLDGLTDKNDTSEIIEIHRTFQKLLKSYRIVNPLIDSLDFSDRRLQSRRTHEQLLNLVDAVCFLRQMQKEVYDANGIKYIKVDDTDVKIALKLADEIIKNITDDISRPAQDLLRIIGCYVKEYENNFTRRQLREYTGWSQTRLWTYFQELYTYEYVLQSNKNGSLKSYKLAK